MFVAFLPYGTYTVVTLPRINRVPCTAGRWCAGYRHTIQPAGTFANWLIQTQRRQIQRALTNGHERNVTCEDGRQHKASADPLNHCTSLDLPLDVEDSGSTTMGEQQEDPAAALPPGSTAAAEKNA